jgi:hypothetical protein
MRYASIGELKTALIERLGDTGYAKVYPDERAFENAVWKRVVELVSECGLEPDSACLTSHKENPGRSPVAWKAFCAEALGPDVLALDSKNRLDIVVKHPDGGTIGIEVKCLGGNRHAAKLTQGLGQAMLALAHRDYSILIIHCGAVNVESLRSLTEKLCRGSAASIVLAP